jgi:hypothetical protein
MKNYTISVLAFVGLILFNTNANAGHAKKVSGDKNGLLISSTANEHAPIGVMGDHTHNKGEWMLSYRFMHMNMDGSRKGTDDISPTKIATTERNRFFGVAGQPPTLRVVPTEMTMDMHMFGAMYAPTDWITLMAMGNYIEKDMDHITFAGGAGNNILGEFSTESKGWGDVKLSSLFSLHEGEIHNLHLNVGFSIPTGDIDNTATVLAPNGLTPRLRMPYAMQLGTGTYDLIPGITYFGLNDRWSWGAQYSSEIRLEDENDEGYSWGDKHTLTFWSAFEWAPWASTSVRLTGATQDSIDGIDTQIIAPVQTADPDNYGGEHIEIGLGVNFMALKGPLKSHRLAMEINTPVYQDLNGVQLETDWSLTVGWQYAF